MLFGKQELEYLSHIISSLGVKVDQNKIKAMLDWPHPTNVSELRGFLGIIGYYRKFVHNYSVIACHSPTFSRKDSSGGQMKLSLSSMDSRMLRLIHYSCHA